MNRREFRERAEREIIRLDGATGTELMKRGMVPGVSPELWVCEHPEALNDLHLAYLNAGSNLLYVPSFGANEVKLAEYGLASRLREINMELVKIARRSSKDAMLFGDIGGTGRLLQPTGEMDFEECVAIFRRQAEALLAAGVDGFGIETMLDLNEARAAVLAVRELTDELPVIVTLTVESGGRTLTGCDPAASLVALQDLGVDAFGCNCSTGPAEIAKIISAVKPYAKIPLVAKPNAGMPHLDKEGRTVFDLSPEEFAEASLQLLDAGASIIGGCCGTTPEHIAALTRKTADRRPEVKKTLPYGFISSSSRIVRPGCNSSVVLIGERINPTGKKALQADLRAGSMDMVFDFAREQEAQGADVLDVNFGLADIDEADFMRNAAVELPAVTRLPLCFDTTDARSAETALRRYAGRALFNSISAEKSRIENLLPVVVRYGALPVLLPLADNGVPSTAAERKAILKRLLDAVEACGRNPREALADALIMTVGTNPEAPREALEFIRYCANELDLPTVCGLSNVSFGLPGRPEINRSFLALSQANGLAAVIANPSSPGIVAQLVAGDALLGRDEQLEKCVSYFSGMKKVVSDAPAQEAKENVSAGEQLREALLQGRKNNLENILQEVLTNVEPAKVVQEILIPALGEVGDKFGRKELFLPQLMQSAAVMKTAMEILNPLLEKNTVSGGPTVVFATVEGDIHDIGKNIVILLMRNHGFDVIDLGKDVSPQKIVDVARESKAALVALSALMTTTMPKMRETIELLRAGNLNMPVMVGGAAVDQEFAESIGAYYSSDAAGAVKVAQALTGE